MRVKVVSGQRRVLLSVPEGSTVGGFSERVASMCELNEVPALFLDGFRLLENEDAAQVLRDNDTVHAGGTAMSGAMSVAMNTHVSAAKRQCLPPPPFFSGRSSNYCPSFSDVRSYVSLSRFRAPSEAPSRSSYCAPHLPRRDVQRKATDVTNNIHLGEHASTRLASAPSKDVAAQKCSQENAGSGNVKHNNDTQKRDSNNEKVTVDGVNWKTVEDNNATMADVAHNTAAPSSWELPRRVQWPATDSVWVAMEGGVSTSRPWVGEFVRYRIVEFDGTPPTPTMSKPKVGYVDQVLNNPLRLVLVSKRKTFDVVEASSILQPHVLQHSRKPKSHKQGVSSALPTETRVKTAREQQVSSASATETRVKGSSEQQVSSTSATETRADAVSEQQVSSAPAPATKGKVLGEQQEQQDLRLRLQALKQRLSQQKTQEQREQDQERDMVPDQQQEVRNQDERELKAQQHRQKQMLKLQGMLEQVLQMEELAEEEEERDEQQHVDWAEQEEQSAQKTNTAGQKLLQKQQQKEQKVAHEQERERQKLHEQRQQEREKQQQEEHKWQERKQMERQHQYVCAVEEHNLLETPGTARAGTGTSDNSRSSALPVSTTSTLRSEDMQSTPVEHHASGGQVDTRSAATFQRMGDGTIRHPLLGDLEVPAGEDAEKFVSMKLRRLRQAVKRQIEYYFSDENWSKDTFLQSAQDACGFVSITLICSFNRVKAMCTDRNFILDCLKDSEVVEISGKYMRRRSASWPAAVKKWSKQREEALASL